MAGSIRYTTNDSVKARLIQKVQFQSNSTLEQGELPNVLLSQLIQDAETEVEQELRGRYSIPFRSIKNGTFEGLPDHTKRAIRIVVDLKSVLNILETDFGDGGTFDSAAYTKSTRNRYDENIKRLLGHDLEAETRDVKRMRNSPPLDDLELASSNKADDGVRGTIFGASTMGPSFGDYAAGQINDPSQGIIRGWGRGGIGR